MSNRRRGGGQGGGRPAIGGGGAATARAGRMRVGEEKHVDGGRGGEKEGDSNFKF